MSVSPGSGYPIIALDSAGNLLESPLDLDHLWWVSKGATIGDDLKVSDYDSNYTIVEACAAITSVNMPIPINRRVAGIKLTTLDSGTLFVVKKN